MKSGGPEYPELTRLSFNEGSTSTNGTTVSGTSEKVYTGLWSGDPGTSLVYN